MVQEWRWALLRALHEDAEACQPGALAQHYEPLLFRWMRLRKAVGALLAAAGAPATASGTWADAVQSWAAAAEQLDTAAGMAAGAAPPKPLLWKAGWRPVLPRSLELSEAYSQLLALCDATRHACCLLPLCDALPLLQPAFPASNQTTAALCLPLQGGRRRLSRRPPRPAVGAGGSRH